MGAGVILRLPGHSPRIIPDSIYRTVRTFAPADTHYLVTPAIPYISLPIIAFGAHNFSDQSPFSERKLEEIFAAFRSSRPLPPVVVKDGKLINGFHRYYCAAAVGYREVPVAVLAKMS